MIVNLQAVRVYGSQSQYAAAPQANALASPIILENYPVTGEKLYVYIGKPPQWIFRANQVCRQLGKHMLGKTSGPMYEPHTERDRFIKEAIDDLNSYPLKSKDYNWYIAIILERQIEIENVNITENKYCWLKPKILIHNNDVFLKYSTHFLDTIAIYLSTIIDHRFFDKLILNERIFFSANGYETFGFPQFSFSGSASISLTMPPLNIEKISKLLEKTKSIPKSRRNQLDKVMSLYWTSVKESDPLKKYLWGFFALELLSNKLYSKFHSEILSNLKLNLNDNEDQNYVSVPSSLVWKPQNLNFPLETKFAIVALKLCPQTAATDSDEFSKINRARNNLAHRGEANDLPNEILKELLKKYIAAAVHYQING